MISGIYTITSPSSGQYVGSAVNFVARWRQHQSDLRRGRHGNRALQRAFIKYGNDKLIFSKLLICRREDLIFFEQRSIDILKPRYNACPTAGSQLGRNHSDESKAKISASKKGQGTGIRRDPEIVEKTAAKLRGRKNGPHSQEHRAKQSVSLKGKKHQDSFVTLATPKLKQELATAYIGGKGLVTLSKEHRVDHRVLRQLLISEGVKIRPKHITIKRRTGKLPRDEIDRRQATRKANSEIRGYW